MFFASIFAAFWVGPTYAAVQNLVEPRWRSQASAILLMVFNLLGMGFGPLLVGMLSDSLAPNYAEQSIRYALALSLITVFIGSLLYWLASSRYGAYLVRRT